MSEITMSKTEAAAMVAIIRIILRLLEGNHNANSDTQKEQRTIERYIIELEKAF